MMTPRERVIASLEHRQPDRTPYCVGFTQPAYAKMADYLGDPDFGEKLGNCLLELSPEAPDAWREVRPDVFVDQFGVAWDRSVDKDIGVVCNQAITPDAFDAFAWPDPHDPRRYADYDAAVAAHPDLFTIVNLGFSLFERAWTLYGMENLFVAMASDPAFAHRLFDRILEFNLAVIDHACGHPIDGMFFGDDWGMQRGLLMGYDYWATFIKPRVRQMYQAVRQRGKYVFIHSCGKVDALFPDLIACGLQCFNPFQPEVIDVFDAKRRYGAELAFFGGISTQRTLPYATPDQTRDAVRRLLDEVGRDGGLIAAPAHAIPRDAKPENIAAMLEVLQES